MLISLLLADARAADYDAVIVGGGRGLVKLTVNSPESRDAERLPQFTAELLRALDKGP